jgi:hypothetical protein
MELFAITRPLNEIPADLKAIGAEIRESLDQQAVVVNVNAAGNKFVQKITGLGPGGLGSS